MTTEAPAPYRIIDRYHGWHVQPDDERDHPGGIRGASEPQREVLRIIREAPIGSTTIIGYGGAAGGGKSNLLGNVAYKVGYDNPGSSLLVARQAMVHLKPTTLQEFDECVDPRLGIKKYDTSPVYRDVRLDASRDWSRVWFRPLDDWMSLMSTQYNGVLIEEGQETAERAFLGLLSRLRHPATNRWFAIVSFNPFPSWAVDWFMHGEAPPEIANDPDVHVHFVPSRIKDNPYLRAGYERMLRATYSNDPWMTAVLIDGVAEHVPNAIFGVLNDPDMRRLVQGMELPEPSEWERAGTGWDWGTTQAHKSAGVLLAKTRQGVVWVLDAWESPLGSSDELIDVAEQFKRESPIAVRTARYDKSQASLEDPLKRLFDDVAPGIRDVEGRIRVGRGVIYSERLRFNWRSAGARKLYNYLTLYHRDDDDKIVEVMDDMVDGFLYELYDMENPVATYADAGPPRASEMKFNIGDSPAKRNPWEKKRPPVRDENVRVG